MDKARSCLLSGGDDYELLFSAAPDARVSLSALATRLKLPLHRIGQLTAEAGTCLLRNESGQCISVPPGGYDHFA